MKSEVISSDPEGTWKPVIWARPAMSVGVMWESDGNGGVKRVDTNEIELLELRDDGDVYLRPTRPYFNAEFEALFRFGCGCSGYDENRIVKIIKTNPPTKLPLYYPPQPPN